MCSSTLLWTTGTNNRIFWTQWTWQLIPQENTSDSNNMLQWWHWLWEWNTLTSNKICNDHAHQACLSCSADWDSSRRGDLVFRQCYEQTLLFTLTQHAVGVRGDWSDEWGMIIFRPNKCRKDELSGSPSVRKQWNISKTWFQQVVLLSINQVWNIRQKCTPLYLVCQLPKPITMHMNLVTEIIWNRYLGTENRMKYVQWKRHMVPLRVKCVWTASSFSIVEVRTFWRENICACFQILGTLDHQKKWKKC